MPWGPMGVPQQSRPSGCPPQPQQGLQHPPGGRGVPAAPLAPRAPTADLAPLACGSTATSSAPSFASGAGGAPPHPSCFRLPGCPCPSVHLSICPSPRAQHTHGLAVPSWREQGRAPRSPSSGGPVPSQRGSLGREGAGDTPSCWGRPPRWALPGHLTRVGQHRHRGCWCPPPSQDSQDHGADPAGGQPARAVAREMGQGHGDGEGATTAASTRGGAGEPYPGLEPSPGTEPRGGEARAPLTSA